MASVEGVSVDFIDIFWSEKIVVRLLGGARRQVSADT